MKAHFGGQSSILDGNRAGRYVMPVQNVNLMVSFAELLPEGSYEVSSVEEDEDDLESQFLVDDPVGPTLADHLVLLVQSKKP